MDNSHANNIAELCEMDGVDGIYYGIYELFPNSKISCAGIMQHYCTAKMHKEILERQHEYCELIGIKVIIKPVDTEFIHNFALNEFFKDI